jgi:hypothetical protein
MVAEIALVVSVAGAVLGLVQASAGPNRKKAAGLTAEAAIREAMRGSEARAVQAEFRRRGVSPPVSPRPLPIVPPPM